jgi:hypothetical protein
MRDAAAAAAAAADFLLISGPCSLYRYSADLVASLRVIEFLTPRVMPDAKLTVTQVSLIAARQVRRSCNYVRALRGLVH